jgi:hypothetical protein
MRPFNPNGLGGENVDTKYKNTRPKKKQIAKVIRCRL